MKQNEEIIYGSLGQRVKAIFVDSLVIAVFGVLTSMLLREFSDIPDYYRAVPFVFIFLIYDPLFVSLFGGTLGHLVMGLRVREAKEQTKKIIFPFAFIRFIVKICLGWLSLLTVTGNKKKQSIHDSVIGSVVLKS